MAQPSLFAYNSFIKNIFLEIPRGYTYQYGSAKIKDEPDEDEQDHELDDDKKEPDFFVGRKQLLNSFKDVLTNGNSRGAFLVTGYRGMGKTSFVNKAINELIQQKVKRIKDEKKDTAGRKKRKKKIEFTDDDRKIKIFQLSLAQSELKDIDILKQIVSQIQKKIEEDRDFRYTRRVSLDNIFSWLLPIIMLVLITMSFVFIVKNGEEPSTVIENLLGITTAASLLTVFVYKYVDWISTTYGRLNAEGKKSLLNEIVDRIFIEPIVCLFITHLVTEIVVFFLTFVLQIPENYIAKNLLSFSIWLASWLAFVGITAKNLLERKQFKDDKKSIKETYKQVSQLYKRCNAQMTSEDQFRDSISSSISALFKRDVLIFPIANAKEVEAELITILDNLKGHYNCIFIFDELDKVDPIFDNSDVTGGDSYGDKRTHLNDLRERRHTITRILGSLKYFINEAEARFIFIAGREMFEAALADISDRQSSISSIFHRVFYVNSFLKDPSHDETIASSIGVSVEVILKKLLLPSFPSIDFFTGYYDKLVTQHNPRLIKNVEFKKPTKKLKLYTNYVSIDNNAKERLKELMEYRSKEVIEHEARKIIFVLQNFLSYLIYRSNGAPKKVIKLLEEYIVYEKLSSYEKKHEQKNFIHSRF